VIADVLDSDLAGTPYRSEHRRVTTMQMIGCRINSIGLERVRSAAKTRWRVGRDHFPINSLLVNEEQQPSAHATILK
jgi:hypothetical protein